jgi:hypothetical protein
VIVDCPTLELIRDVCTRWNSTNAMIERAIKLKDAYQSMCRNEPPLEAYVLDEAEWAYLEKLHGVLAGFDKMTETVSGSFFPTLNRAMSVYNRLIDNLEDFIRDVDDPLLKEAADQGRTKLLKYYSKTDSTPVYAVATAMDPRMRYNWWKAQGWDEYVQVSIDAVKSVWEDQYKGKEGPRLLDSEIAKEMALYGIKQQAGELEEYTNEGATLITCKTEPPELLYWRSQEERWPNLANMARDFLAIPVTSTPAERCFSQAKFILPSERNALLPASVQRLVLVDSWLGHFPYS